jgi:monofunctional biosynthetic peptidoglycan transglycosylase
MLDSELDRPTTRASPRRRARAWPWIGLVLALLVALPFAASVAYRWAPPPASMLMAIRWAQGHAIDYRWVPLEHISPHLARAVLTAEDARFCEHRGIDWEALDRLMSEPGGPSRGGSTIAMQTAKNLFLWPSRSYVRKAAELPLAAWIDLVWPKPRVIEVYLNIAEWGPGIFGAEAAAQRHFGKPAADITPSEAALLAAALPNPHERNVAKPGPGLRRLAAHIARRVPATTSHLGCLGS